MSLFGTARGRDRFLSILGQTRERLKYMRRNPVKRGLVESPEQWTWSSYRFYLLDEPGPVQVNVGWGEISFRSRAA